MKSLAIISKKQKADAWVAGQALQAWFVSRGLAALHLENEPEPDIAPLPPETTEVRERNPTAILIAYLPAARSCATSSGSKKRRF